MPVRQPRRWPWCTAVSGPVAWQRGIGLHSGRPVAARVCPGSGQLWVRRVDLPGRAGWRVDLDRALAVERRTAIGDERGAVSTLEHLLSALFALGIYDATIEVDGAELPSLDGSARGWAELLRAVATPLAVDPPELWRVERSLTRARGSSSCRLQPHESELIVACTIDFDHPVIGRQRRVWRATSVESYFRDVAPARTFGMLADAKELHARGLAGGASLDNTVVFDDERVLNAEGLRFTDEPVRHKILDALGDLCLLGAPLVGAVQLERCSHALLIETLRAARDCGALQRITRGGG